jgi:hypothetical protein
MKQEKKEREWPVADKSAKRYGHKIFIESLGEYGSVLEKDVKEDIRALFNSNLQWKSKSKGSVIQYLESFPEDALLQKWVSYID